MKLALSPTERHGCTVAAVVAREGDALVYRGPVDDAYVHGHPCVLTVRRRGAALMWDDRGTCRSECETGGLLRRGRLPWSSRQPITDAAAAALRRSPDFRAAIADWRGSR